MKRAWINQEQLNVRNLMQISFSAFKGIGGDEMARLIATVNETGNILSL